MADDGLRWRKVPGPVARVFGSLGVSALVQSLGDQELDAPMPKVVWHTGRSSQLRALAFDLAEAGRDDQDAVAELVRVAGRHPKELRRAAATIRADGRAEEELVAFRANRLLVSAASGQPVGPISAEKLAWFARERDLAEACADVAPPATDGAGPPTTDDDAGDDDVARDLDSPSSVDVSPGDAPGGRPPGQEHC
jgi:hypothetical protein